MLNPLVSSKQIRCKQLKQSALMVGSQIKSSREFQTVGPATKKGSATISVVTVYMSRYDNAKCSEHLYVKFSSLAKN